MVTSVKCYQEVELGLINIIDVKKEFIDKENRNDDNKWAVVLRDINNNKFYYMKTWDEYEADTTVSKIRNWIYTAKHPSPIPDYAMGCVVRHDGSLDPALY